jgi:hypothetical protein
MNKKQPVITDKTRKSPCHGWYGETSKRGVEKFSCNASAVYDVPPYTIFIYFIPLYNNIILGKMLKPIF